MATNRKYLIAAALDFGTTFSGYAFSFLSDFEEDPLKIRINNTWESTSRSLMSYKTPTCLLLDENKEFVAFGYDAEDIYADKVLEKQHEDYFYFYRFKMSLHNNKNITKSMVLEDIRGRTVPAVDVFKFSIKALVDHLRETLSKCGKVIEPEEIRYVLTVPAIWTDAAKEFMRKSAQMAGIPGNQLVLALEPEAASIYCQYLPTEKLSGSEGFKMSRAGTTYMVVDLGGGTADITVHKKAADDHLIEKYRATGNACGGTSVDKELFALLTKIIGENAFEKMAENNPLEYLDISREFECAKRSMKPSLRTKININLPMSVLNRLCKSLHNKEFPEVLNASALSSKIGVVGDKIRLDKETGKNMFQQTINNIILLIKEILSHPETNDVSMILLVGGFSECQFVQDAVKEAFPGKRLIIPEDSGLSVLKGAVLYGHRSDYIQERVMRFTYGIKTNVEYDERKFDRKLLKKIDGKDRVDDIFSIIISKDERVEAGTVIQKSYHTVHRNQETLELSVYTSDERYPSFVYEQSCRFLSEVTIIFADTCEEIRYVDVDFIFGNTEIGLVAVDRRSGKKITANFDFI